MPAPEPSARARCRCNLLEPASRLELETYGLRKGGRIGTRGAQAATCRPRRRKRGEERVSGGGRGCHRGGRGEQRFGGDAGCCMCSKARAGVARGRGCRWRASSAGGDHSIVVIGPVGMWASRRLVQAGVGKHWGRGVQWEQWCLPKAAKPPAPAAWPRANRSSLLRCVGANGLRRCNFNVPARKFNELGGLIALSGARSPSACGDTSGVGRHRPAWCGSPPAFGFRPPARSGARGRCRRKRRAARLETSEHSPVPGFRSGSRRAWRTFTRSRLGRLGGHASRPSSGGSAGARRNQPGLKWHLLSSAP